MMHPITLNYEKSSNYIKEGDLAAYAAAIKQCHEMLHQGTGPGSDYRGWLDLPANYDREEIRRIKAAAEDIRGQAEVFLVVGIGGSYLGARAALEMLRHSFYNELPADQRGGPRIYFAGHNLSSAYMRHLLDIVGDKEIFLNIISKSGTTTEPALAFGLLKDFMENKYGKMEASRRIYVTTDRQRGKLRELAEAEGYESFVIPDDIGGRYSVLTPVGLLPMAAAGIDIEEVLLGAQAAAKDLMADDWRDNHAYRYAAIRNILYEKGFITEILVSYEPQLASFGEWFKQLFGESEGKEGKGIFPAAVNFSTDLHSLGQYIQEGRRHIFETVLNVEKSSEEIRLQAGEIDMGFNYLAGKPLSFVNEKAMEGTITAHVKGGAPNLIINVPELTPYYFGYMTYFFQKACALSGYLLGVNPFDQPGVEAYKKEMRELLR
ncbi:MAG: glucose-6-phosphate isomerase [Syntrophomonadaceae bacterium]|nr:glucose-6-phosphate isomerase [Syntrophomonadaceae bacterium]